MNAGQILYSHYKLGNRLAPGPNYLNIELASVVKRTYSHRNIPFVTIYYVQDEQIISLEFSQQVHVLAKMIRFELVTMYLVGTVADLFGLPLHKLLEKKESSKKG